ncbi:SseB family protein [Microbacterium sediminis]|uniref:SseB protein N-terminal domain-containing protein n=1 Tax=Microbacterium sediminis TaxID=904291 RepID=A0A1B9NHX6_9MICO|nr:SseB family protein [Microbacterium sediminis]OCG76208.1 hypothetical protein A7J15_12335 [Microbacterium sediminis]
MGLFSRKKKDDRDPKKGDAGTPEAESTPPAAPEAAPEATPPAPTVGISMSSFAGLGAAGAPVEPAAPTDGTPRPEPLLARAAADPRIEVRAHNRPALPFAPPSPPTVLETVPGLRDNAPVRDALAALPDKPSGAEVPGVVRQVMQGNLYLRVQGDAREQLRDGGQITFGVARAGDKDYILAYSSGQALRDAVAADGDTQTSAIGQPVSALVRHMLQGTFAGIILDNHSAHRAVIPREVLQKAFEQADPQARVKTLLAQPREADTPRRLASVLAERPPLWVAVGPSQNDKDKMGIAEARLADGTRLLQVFSHPLEIAAIGRNEKALPLDVAKIAKALADHPQVGGVIIDPAGPLMTLTREELAPVLALAE